MTLLLASYWDCSSHPSDTPRQFRSLLLLWGQSRTDHGNLFFPLRCSLLAERTKKQVYFDFLAIPFIEQL